MGKYDVDFSNKEIIVDGHICVETEYDGIYKVQDKFEVTIEEWFYNELNHNLTALYVHNGNHGDNQSILYVVKYDNPNIKRFKDDKKLEGLIISELICASCDGAVWFGGLLTGQGI